MSFCVLYFLLSAFSCCLTIRNCRYYYDRKSLDQIAIPLDECSYINYNRSISVKYVCNDLNDAINAEVYRGTTCSGVGYPITISATDDKFDCQSTEACNTVDVNIYMADTSDCTGTNTPLASYKWVADDECFPVNTTYSTKSECTADGTFSKSSYYGSFAKFCLFPSTSTYTTQCYYNSDQQVYKYQEIVNCEMMYNVTTTTGPPTTTTTPAPPNYYYENVYPDPNSITNHSVNITSVDDSQDTIFYVTFAINSNPCYKPTISFKYEQIDISLTSEYISVYNDNNVLIKQCQGNNGTDTQCGVFWDCFSNYPLGIDKIDVDSNYTVQVVESAGTDALCDHPWTINAQLTLICDASTTDIPTTPNPTTSNPTTAIPTTTIPTTAIPITAIPTTLIPTTTNSPTTSIPTDEAICVTGTVDVNSHVLGTYDFSYFNPATNSSIYLCSECGFYMYSYTFTASGNNYWYIGTNVNSTIVYAHCEVRNINIKSYSCIGNWRVWNGIRFELIVDMKAKKCSEPTEPPITRPTDVNDLCISGTIDSISHPVNILGTYEWVTYNPYISESNVYLCLDCDQRDYTVYLFNYDLGNKNCYWFIGPGYLRFSYYAYCSIVNLDITTQSCEGSWQYYDVDKDTMVVVPDMKAVDCVTTTTTTTTDAPSTTISPTTEQPSTTVPPITGTPSITTTTSTTPTHTTQTGEGLEGTDDKNADALSTEIIVGIIVAAAIVLLIFILLFYYCMTKNSKKTDKGYDTVQTDENPNTKTQQYVATYQADDIPPPPPLPTSQQMQPALPQEAIQVNVQPTQSYQEYPLQMAPPPVANIQMVNVEQSENMALVQNNDFPVHEWFNNNVKISQEDGYKYADLFIANGWNDITAFRHITNQDLIDVGISKLYHRKLILKATQQVEVDKISQKSVDTVLSPI